MWAILNSCGAAGVLKSTCITSGTDTVLPSLVVDKREMYCFSVLTVQNWVIEMATFKGFIVSITQRENILS